jgi:hypothetical protein
MRELYLGSINYCTLVIWIILVRILGIEKYQKDFATIYIYAAMHVKEEKLIPS